MIEIPKALIRNACLAADRAAMQPHATKAEETRAIVTRALEALANNGQIKIVKPDHWPGWFIVDPPYSLPLRPGSAT